MYDVCMSFVSSLVTQKGGWGLPYICGRNCPLSISLFLSSSIKALNSLSLSHLLSSPSLLLVIMGTYVTPHNSC